MSLFDFIDNEANQPPDPVTVPKETTTKSPARGTGKYDKQKTNIQGSRKPKPEKLKFLKPCPVCQGREFVHGKNNGFFCISCQPGIEGNPVIALGHRKIPQTVKGLPCAGCGSTTYRKEKNGFIFDDGTLADGWHCGGRSCSVKLRIGTHEIHEAGPGEQGQVSVPATKDDQPLQHFQAAYPWIMDHISELLLAGWKRPELFRRGKNKWPTGEWGVAWLSVWIKDDLRIEIGSQGILIFKYSSSGRHITQTAVHKQYNAGIRKEQRR